MAENLAECEYVHAVHQTALGEVVAQTMRRDGVLQTGASQILFEVGFEVGNADGAAAFGGEEVIAFGVSVFELHPTADDRFRSL